MFEQTGKDTNEEVVDTLRSQTGGHFMIGPSATEVLARQLSGAPPTGQYAFPLAAYIDAVDHDGSAQENERPVGTLFHLNIYQENGPLELGGGPIRNPQPQDEEINVTVAPGWDHTLDHFQIDNDQQVMGRVIERVEEHVDR